MSIKAKKQLLKLSPEETLRFEALMLKEHLTDDEHQEYLNFLKRTEGAGGEFLDQKEFYK